MESRPLAIPSTASRVSAEWLGAVLRASGHAPPDSRLRIQSVEPIGQGFGLASERVRVRFDVGGGPTASAVVKLWGFEDRADACEVPFYQSLAPRCGIRLPACFHADRDDRVGRAVLVLEEWTGAQGDCLAWPTRAQAVALAGTLGVLHAAWWGRAELREADWLPEATVARPPDWIDARAPEFLRELGGGLTPAARGLVACGAAMQVALRDRLEGAPATLLHGDLHLDNVLFERGSGQPLLLDWARTARGPYALDLGDLLFGVVAAEDREESLQEYLSRARAGGASIPAEATVRRHLAGALLRFFYRSTLGVARWKPGTERERRMREEGVRRATAAVAEWREEAQDQGSPLRDPGGT